MTTGARRWTLCTSPSRGPVGAEPAPGAGYKSSTSRPSSHNDAWPRTCTPALRGAIPRQSSGVTKGTYLQIWWPPFDEEVYVDRFPFWDREGQCYRDPTPVCH